MVDREAAAPPYTLAYGFEAEVSIPPLPFQSIPGTDVYKRQFCALAGVLWYMQFFGLEMGKSFLTGSPVLLAFSWCILMALNVTFSNVWGILLKEWKGVSTQTITVLVTGLVVLIFSLVFPNLF